jgi:hypothetical protein
MDFGKDTSNCTPNRILGEARVAIGAAFNGVKFEAISFNPAYLLECAQNLKDRETITIDFWNELSPCVIHIPFFKYVLMPMRLDESPAAKQPAAPVAPAPIAEPIPAPVPPAAAEVKPEPKAPAIVPWTGADTIPAEKCFVLSVAHLFFVTVTDG